MKKFDVEINVTLYANDDDDAYDKAMTLAEVLHGDSLTADEPSDFPTIMEIFEVEEEE